MTTAARVLGPPDFAVRTSGVFGGGAFACAAEGADGVEGFEGAEGIEGVDGIDGVEGGGGDGAGAASMPRLAATGAFAAYAAGGALAPQPVCTDSIARRTGTDVRRKRRVGWSIMAIAPKNAAQRQALQRSYTSSSHVISIIVGRKPARANRRWAVSFWTAVRRTTRGAPFSRIRAFTSRTSASPTPRDRARSST